MSETYEFKALARFDETIIEGEVLEFTRDPDPLVHISPYSGPLKISRVRGEKLKTGQLSFG